MLKRMLRVPDSMKVVPDNSATVMPSILVVIVRALALFAVVMVWVNCISQVLVAMIVPSASGTEGKNGQEMTIVFCAVPPAPSTGLVPGSEQLLPGGSCVAVRATSSSPTHSAVTTMSPALAVGSWEKKKKKKKGKKEDERNGGKRRK